MSRKHLSMTARALAASCLSGAAMAQDASPAPLAEQQAKVQLV